MSSIDNQKQKAKDQEEKNALSSENVESAYKLLLSNPDAVYLLVSIAKTADMSAGRDGMQSNQTFSNVGKIAYAKDLVSTFRKADYEAWQKIEVLALKPAPRVI